MTRTKIKNHFLHSPQIQFRTNLQNEFARRCRTNSRYSIRAFARFLELDASTLAKILSGKRDVSIKLIDRVYEKIGAPPENQQNSNAPHTENYVQVSQDIFSAIADWYHIAILDLTFLKNFKSDPLWIAKTLNISKAEAQMAVERLLRLGLLKKQGARWVKSETHLNTYFGKTSLAHKEYQRQVIQKALQAIDQCPAPMKDITNIVISGDSKKLETVRGKITQFRREICQFMEEGSVDSVFHLAVQLYPVTQTLNIKEDL